jgi:hypothetical protein
MATSVIHEIETFGELFLDAKSKVVRPLTTDGSNAFGLRPCNFNGEDLFMTGTLKHPRFHNATAIIRGLLSGADSFDLPLPDEVPVPEFLTDNSERLAMDGIDFALEYMAGADKTYLTTKYSRALAVAVTQTLRELGMVVGNPSSIEQTILTVRDALAREARQITMDLALRDNAPTSITALEELENKQLDALPYGVISKVPARLYERLSRRAGGITRQGERMKWPFAQMQVGDQVKVDPKLAKRAQSAVHVYANRMGKRFSTYTQPATGALLVIRLEDRSNHVAQPFTTNF